MNNLIFWICLIIAALAIPYTYGGCAGGGGGDESDGITYSGVTISAQISETNAEDITAGAFSAGLIGDSMAGLSLEPASTDYFIREFRTVKVPLILTDSLYQIDFTLSPNLITFNAYGQDTISGKTYWIRDYSILIDGYTGFVEIEMAGRFYRPDYGYVTLSTVVPFVLHDGDEWPTSGTLIATGGNNSKARISAIDNLHCTIEADVDGESIFPDYDA